MQYYQSLYQQASAEVSGWRIPLEFTSLTDGILPCHSLISCSKNVSGLGCFSYWIADICFALGYGLPVVNSSQFPGIRILTFAWAVKKMTVLSFC